MSSFDDNVHDFLMELIQHNPFAPSVTPPNLYLFKVNNRNPRKRCEICSKITTKTPERRH